MEAKRITFTLDGAERAALSAFADPERAERAALDAWVKEHGLQLKDSEAGMIRVLLSVALDTLREKALDQGYARLAVEQQADRDRLAERESRRARRSERDRAASA